MGGIRVDERLETGIAGLFAAGEAIGGPNGANRLSGNAITEALVFGERAGRMAAEAAGEAMPDIGAAAAAPLAVIAEAARRGNGHDTLSPSAAIADLQQVMQRDVGPFRTGAGLQRALARIAELRRALPEMPVGSARAFNQQRADWFELRNMLPVAESVARAALARTESRGAHQRDDFPTLDDGWTVNQVVRLEGDALSLARTGVQALDGPELEVAS
jgi:succinate dehydrogenase / fumarate reductase flavoprotein subunit